MLTRDCWGVFTWTLVDCVIIVVQFVFDRSNIVHYPKTGCVTYFGRRIWTCDKECVQMLENLPQLTYVVFLLFGSALYKTNIRNVLNLKLILTYKVYLVFYVSIGWHPLNHCLDPPPRWWNLFDVFASNSVNILFVILKIHQEDSLPTRLPLRSIPNYIYILVYLYRFHHS